MKFRTARHWVTLWVALIVAACGGGGGGSPDVTDPPHPVVPPPQGVSTDTVKFGNTGFAEIEIRNSFAFIVQYGDRFDIEMTVDSQYSDLVSVTQEGVRLTIEFDPGFTGDIRAQVARGIVTLPLLNVLDVQNSAFVDMAGFNQSYLQIRQNGSSHVEGANGQFDLVDAVLNGSSHLSLTGVSPLAAVNVMSNGSSQATLGMMDGGTLTGSATGSSNVSYYGRDVSLLVDTHDTATITWLGVNGS